MDTSEIVLDDEAPVVTHPTIGAGLYGHVWSPPAAFGDGDAPRGVVVAFHGYGAHGGYPTVALMAEPLARAGFVVVTADMPGHGRSPGTPGLLDSAEMLLEHGEVRRSVVSRRAHAVTVVFLFHTCPVGGAPYRVRQTAV